jgi:hypothetical protein
MILSCQADGVSNATRVDILQEAVSLAAHSPLLTTRRDGKEDKAILADGARW